MKKLLSLSLFTFTFSFAATAADVQPLAKGANVVIGGPAKVLLFEAVASAATGSATVKRVIDTWTYSTATASVTNSFTNAVSWTERPATNRVISVVDDYLTVTNAVYTNVVGTVTNVVYNTTRRPNGYHSVTNDIIVTNAVWTTSSLPFKTSAVTNDVVSHAVITNTVGTITISNHVGTLKPTDLYITGGDVFLIEYSGSAAFRLFTQPEAE